MPEDFIPLSAPNLKGRELELVTKAIEAEWVSTAGPYVDQFEHDIADYLNVPGAVACQSGTAGLHVSLLLAGVTNADVVIVPALTFIAAVNPVAYIGAQPVFMDCDDSLCMDPSKLAKFCSEDCSFESGELRHKTTGKRVGAIVVVHVFGNMADMQAILEIADRYGIPVVEDATEALGTRYEEGLFTGRYAGTMGDFGVYSFNGNKIITTGGGGMIVARNKDALLRAKHITTQAKSDPVYFEHDEIGYNYRLTNVQAAIGVAQLEQLESFIQVKERNYERYKKQLYSCMPDGFSLLGFRPGTRSNRWFYSLKCPSSLRDAVIQKLSEKDVQTRPVWGIICDQPPYRGSLEFEVELAREYRASIVNLPCSTNLSIEDIDRVVTVLGEVFNEAR